MVVSIPKHEELYSSQQGGGLDPSEALELEVQVQMLLQRGQ